MALNLGAKISIAATIPSLAFVIVTSMMVKNNLTERQNAVDTDANIEFIKSVSYYVHETQKERARSLGFVNGIFSVEELEAQRSAADTQKNLVLENLKKVSIPQSHFDHATSAIQSHLQFRKAIASKEAKNSEVIQKLTSFIGELLKTELTIANETQVPGINERIRSVNIL